MTNKWRIFGQDNLIAMLERDIVSGKIAHSILLTGPAKVGKFTILLKMAQFLQCENNFCGTCKTCEDIAKMEHLDTMIFEDNDESKLGIEEIRDLINLLNLSTQSKYKIVIIQNIERLSVPALNSLLKILEEPPGKVMFLLTTTDHKNVLPTIVSRCRLYRATLNSDEKIKGYLTLHYSHINADILDKIVAFSCGRIGKAIELIESNEMTDKYAGWLQELTFIDKNPEISDLINFAEKISELKGGEFDDFASLFMYFLRTKMGAEDRREVANKLILAQKTFNLISQNVNAKMALQVLFLRSFSKHANLVNQ